MVLRRSLLASLLALAPLARPAPAALAGDPPEVQRPPNVLFVIVDDMHVRELGSYGGGVAGGPLPLTPRLDSLAAEGVRFERAYTTVAQCSPARFSLLTGRFPHEHGLRWNGVWEPPQVETTFADLMRDAGYATASIGKHHMRWLWQKDRPVEDLGFDTVINISEYRRYCTLNGVPFYDAPLNFTQMPGLPPILYAVGTTENPNEFHPSGFFAERAMEFIDQHAGPGGDGKPFLCWLSFYGPHQPTLASGASDPNDFAGMYQPYAQLELPANHDKPATTARLAAMQAECAGIVDSQWRDLLGYHYALVSQIDYNIGRVLDHLDALGIAEDTLVVFTSDHGEMASEMGVFGKGAGNYESVARVPLLMRLPGRLPAGSARDALVSQVDLFPTLLEITGVPVDESVRARLAGRSFLDVALSSATPPGWREAVFVYFGYPVYNVMRQFTVVTQDMKYSVDDLAGVELELYDLANDPLETTNLAASSAPEHVAAVAWHQSLLDEWWNDEEGHAPLYTLAGEAAMPPSRALEPRPMDGAVDQPIDLDLSWLPSTAAEEQHLALGTDTANMPYFRSYGPMVSRANVGTLQPGTTYYWRVDSENFNGAKGGSVWSFTTAAGPPGGPALATDPKPKQGAQTSELAPQLSWAPGPGASAQQLWFGPAGALELLEPALLPGVHLYSPGLLEAGAEYEWRVDSVDANGTTEGDVWSFRTSPALLPAMVLALQPAHLATDVALGPRRATTATQSGGASSPAEAALLEGLVWTEAARARSYDVHFGTVDPPPFVGNQVRRIHHPGALVSGRTYYWRIDAVGDHGTRRGFTYRFTAR